MAVTLLVIVFAGCTPPGPRALLDGERLINEQEFERAVTRLEKATSLMPASARAWNFLGLALHGANRRSEAAQAYQRAVSLDPDLTIVRYNLGCLYLEAGNWEAAAAEFTTFTASQTQSLEGWLKLASAQMRSGKVTSAETSFARVLALDKNCAAAWNGLGLTTLAQGKAKDAGPYFDTALRYSPDFAPAILNRAIYQQQYNRDTPAALQSYRAYLALQPRAPQWNQVRQLVLQLEFTERRAIEPAKSEETTTPLVATRPEPQSHETPDNQEDRENVPSSQPQRTISSSASVPPPVKPEVAPAGRPQPGQPRRQSSPTFEVVQVERPETIRSARDSTVPRQANRFETAEPVEVPPRPAPREKPGLLARLNPANLFRHRPQPETKPTPLPELPTDSSSNTSTAPDRDNSSAPPGKSQSYTYQKNIHLVPGDRSAAQSLFVRGAEAQRVRDLKEGVELYQAAIRADPAYFDVYYNLGLAQYQLGDWTASARAYELALALNPSSPEARYNFSLALKRGGFYSDAARELEKLLVTHPREVEARLTLANLYANELRSPKLARPHYEKVLAQSPAHPQSTEIRFWLREHP